MTQTQQWTLKTAAQIDETDYAQWQRIVDEYHQGNPILSAQFVKLLLEFFCSDYYLASCIEGDATKCMLLIQKRKFGIWHVVQPSQAPSALVIGCNCFSPDFKSLCAILPSKAFRIDFFCLDPKDHPKLIELLAEHSIEQSNVNISIDTSLGIDKYWETRPRKLRQNINRYKNRIKSEGLSLRFNFFTEKNDILHAVDRYGMLESQGWKGKQGTALHPSNKQGIFYQKFLSLFEEHLKPIAIEMYIDAELVASRLCCLSQESIIFLKTTYSESYKNFAPGRLLLAEVLDYVINKKLVNTVEFYTNATEEQIEWSTDTRAMYKASFYKSSFVKLLFTTLSHIKRKIL